MNRFDIFITINFHSVNYIEIYYLCMEFLVIWIIFTVNAVVNGKNIYIKYSVIISFTINAN